MLAEELIAQSDAIGEIRFGFNLLGSVMSRIRLYPAVVEQKRGAPIDVTKWSDEIGRPSNSVEALAEASVEALEKLDYGYVSGGISELMRTSTINMSVAGEMFLVSPKPGQFVIASVDELTDRKSTRLNSSHALLSRMPSSA